MGASDPAGLTGLSAPIPHKKGAAYRRALFAAGFPLQSLALPGNDIPVVSGAGVLLRKTPG
jgi:hypothetical protein